MVEEHQAFETETEAPEFTIAVSYVRMVAVGKSGWKWSICWTDRSGKRQMRAGYGHQTPERAKSAAEFKATQIALSELPEEVYTYRPEFT